MKVYDGASWIAATSAGNVSFLQYEYTATLGQTTFSGADDNAATLSYTVANLIVTLNGVVLDNGGDYTATNGTSVVLASGAAAGDLLQVIAFKSFTVADMVPASTGGTFAGNVAINGNLTVDTNTLFVDASNNRVGVGTSSPAVKLTSQLASSGVSGIAATAAALFENSGNSDVVIAAGTTSKSRVAFADSGDWIIGRIDYDHSDNSMRFGTNGTAEYMRIDSSGNVGIGVVPSAWGQSGTLQAVQIKSTSLAGSGTNAYWGSNWYGGGFDKYIENGAASLAVQTGGQHIWYGAASGTADNAISFSERMRIDASGNLLVGTTSTQGYFDGKLNVAGRIHVKANASAQGSLYYAWTDQSSGSGTLFTFGYGSSFSSVGTITTNGTSTAYNTSSDYRLKEDVQPMVGSVDRLMALKPVNFAWKVDGSRVDGFLAHEAQEVVPEAVTGQKDQTETVEIKDEDGNVTGTEERPVYQGIDQSKLVPLLTAALQEALTKIEALEARVAALEA